MSSLKARCKAVVQLDRAEVAADDARVDLFHAVRTGEPARGYLVAYNVALLGLASARIALERLVGARNR